MRARVVALLLMVACAHSSAENLGLNQAQCVILLHGLAPNQQIYDDGRGVVESSGYVVSNVDYPSTEKRIEDLAYAAVDAGLRQCEAGAAVRVHFLTHSMGGILIRYYLAHRTIAALGRVVMLSPPNQGSEVVDRLRNVPGFYALNGPAGQQLGTEANSIPNELGPIDFELGVIAGNSSINWFLSTLIPGEDDGKVAVERAKIQGMADFVVVPASHPFIMRDTHALAQAVLFLQTAASTTARKFRNRADMEIYGFAAFQSNRE